MPSILPRLCLAAATAVATSVPVAAAAQSELAAQWRTPANFLPPALGSEAPEVAAECLALAIAYEAGFEPVAGQEAVAQVILNRVGHAAYPDTVCGVVWQGAERRTGCQFTFTCDGSLRRARTSGAMAAARMVAVRVLAGESADHVRDATHYHADYVSPYWAPSLMRVRQIARHIFYRSPGAMPRNGDASVAVALSAPAVRDVSSSPAPAAQGDPAIRNGEYAPWGLSVGPARR